MKSKRCKHCEAEGLGPRPASEFYRKTGTFTGLSAACIRHTRAQRHARYEVNGRNWRHKLSKRLSRETGVPFDQVHKVVMAIRKFRSEGGQSQTSLALRRWSSAA